MVEFFPRFLNLGTKPNDQDTPAPTKKSEWFIHMAIRLFSVERRVRLAFRFGTAIFPATLHAKESRPTISQHRRIGHLTVFVRQKMRDEPKTREKN